MSKKITLLVALVLAIFTTATHAQTLDEYKAQLAEKSAELAAIQGEVDAIKANIATFPGWKVGALATLGLNLSNFNNWLGAGNPNASSNSFGISGSAFANLDREKFLWRNSLNIAAAKTKLIPDTDVNSALPDELQADWETTADAINFTSLFGYKISSKIAASAMAEYRSTFLNNFNDPGYLDIGAGATWTPMSNLAVVFHPLNYNIVMSKGDATYDSSLGCKIVADYTQSLPMGIAWRSNLSSFISYSDPGNFSNWTWVNGLNFTAWKGIGVGFEFGLRRNRQESYNTFLTANSIMPETVAIDDFDNSTNDGDNPLQSYWLLGLTYNISK